jgi:hypothetical protein
MVRYSATFNYVKKVKISNYPPKLLKNRKDWVALKSFIYNVDNPQLMQMIK